MKKGVSVILPVINAEKHLRTCLNSLISQKNVNFEIIVQHAGSTDKSAAILNEYLAKIRVFEEADSGLYDAMNRGVQKANYEWLYFIGADDVLINDHVFDQLLVGVKPACKIVFGNIKYINSNNKGIPKVHYSAYGTSLFWRNRLHHQAALYHIDCFESSKFATQYLILSDYAFNLDCLNAGIPGCKTDVLVAECDAKGISKNFNFNLYAEELKLKRIRLPFLIYLINIPWVIIKYIIKNLLQSKSA